MRARGCLSLNGHAFFAIGDTIYELLADGTLNASWGPIENDGKPVYFAANYYQLAFTSGGKAYYIASGSLAEVPWLIGTSVNSCDFLNQYFLFLANSSDVQENGFFYSEPGDVTTGALLNFISAEASANLYERLVVLDQRIWLQGDQITQVFYDNSANDPTNPFVADQSGILQQGTAAPGSGTIFDNTLGWIGRNASGQGIAWRNDGYRPNRVSTFAVEEAWRKYSTIQDAVGWTTIFKGHTVWRLWFPTANETWQYDASLPASLAWTKQLYFNPTSGQYEADRGSCACEVSGRVFVGDRANGKVYDMSLDALNDNGDRIRWLRRAPIISNENKMISFPWFELDMLTGQGDGSNGDPGAGPVSPEYDPAVMMRYSNDWGQTWSNERMRPTGKQGQFGKRVYWTRNGTGRQRVFEISGTANVPVCINNAYLRQPLGRTT